MSARPGSATPDDTNPLTPEREQEIRELSRGAARMAPRGWMTTAQELLAELDRVRVESFARIAELEARGLACERCGCSARCCACDFTVPAVAAPTPFAEMQRANGNPIGGA